MGATQRTVMSISTSMNSHQHPPREENRPLTPTFMDLLDMRSKINRALAQKSGLNPELLDSAFSTTSAYKDVSAHAQTITARSPSNNMSNNYSLFGQSTTSMHTQQDPGALSITPLHRPDPLVGSHVQKQMLNQSSQAFFSSNDGRLQSVHSKNFEIQEPKRETNTSGISAAYYASNNFQTANDTSRPPSNARVSWDTRQALPIFYTPENSPENVNSAPDPRAVGHNTGLDQSNGSRQYNNSKMYSNPSLNTPNTPYRFLNQIEYDMHKRSNLSLSQALNLIPTFDGNPERLNLFCSAIRRIINTYGSQAEQYALLAIANKLTGRAADEFSANILQYTSIEKLLSDIILQYSNIDVQEAKCKNCNNTDHVAEDCTKKKAIRLFCHYCERVGHIFKDCYKLEGDINARRVNAQIVQNSEGNSNNNNQNNRNSSNNQGSFGNRGVGNTPRNNSNNNNNGTDNRNRGNFSNNRGNPQYGYNNQGDSRRDQDYNNDRNWDNMGYLNENWQDNNERYQHIREVQSFFDRNRDVRGDKDKQLNLNKVDAKIHNIKEVNIKLAKVGHSPPVITLKSHSLANNQTDFFIDTGSYISVIKESTIDQLFAKIDRSVVLAIKGVVPGTCFTLGKVCVKADNGVCCTFHIVPDSFPIKVEGLIGWDFIDAHKTRIDAAHKRLELSNNTFIPFKHEESFHIKGRTRQIIFAEVSNINEKVGWVPLQDLGPDLLFGNFLGKNNDGHVYAEILNIGTTPVTIPVPQVNLIPCHTVAPTGDADLDEDDVDSVTSRVNILNLFSDNKVNTPIDVAVRNRHMLENPHLLKERVDKIMKLIDTSSCNAVEKFRGLSLKTDKPIRSKRHRYARAIRENILKKVDKLYEQGVIVPSNSDYSSNLWIVPKNPGPDGEQRWRLFKAHVIKQTQAKKNVGNDHHDSESESTNLDISDDKGMSDKSIVYKKGEIIAVRNSCNGFYLCKALVNIRSNERDIPIMWLSLKENSKYEYFLDYVDHIHFACILTNVRMVKVRKNEFKLNPNERSRIKAVLKESILHSKMVRELEEKKATATDGKVPQLDIDFNADITRDP
ncbi:hypothetical protein TSAR_006609 [Trichomalopsis sarcophagae]|uniref:CCHC-type domain-containing protein n=1 Tax=Trichomalopsis sarcophagae TaxID=543379 RepID=A0A232EJZ7_9HYME|nr:hypothetical protein TSAR_006609 [Trichomalopsis sarcophagae]